MEENFENDSNTLSEAQKRYGIGITNLEDDTPNFWVEKEKEELEEAERRMYENAEEMVFLCKKCGAEIDRAKPPAEPEKLKKIMAGDKKCPFCKNDLVCIALTAKEKEKKDLEKKKKEKAKQRKEEIELERAKEDIKDDCMDLLNDLKERLLEGRITASRFVAVYLNGAYRIVNHYGKKLPIYAGDYRRTFLDLCDEVLSYYQVRDKSVETLAKMDDDIDDTKSLAERLASHYDGDIEHDKLLIAETKFYLEDDKFALPAYEMEERIAEYEKLENEIERQEEKRELEKRYQERVLVYAKKLEERQIRKLERNFD